MSTGHQYIIECYTSTWDGLCLNCCIENLFNLYELSDSSNKDKLNEIGNIMINSINELYCEYDLDEIYEIIQDNMIIYIQASINYHVNYKYNIIMMSSVIENINMKNIISSFRYMSWLEQRLDATVASLHNVTEDFNNIHQHNSKVTMKYNIWILWYLLKSFNTYIDCIGHSSHTTTTTTNQRDYSDQRLLRSFSIKVITSITTLIRYGYLSGRTEDMSIQNYFMEPDMMGDLMLLKITTLQSISTIIKTIMRNTSSATSISSNQLYECDIQCLTIIYDYCLGEIIIDFNQQFKHVRIIIELPKPFPSLSTNSFNGSNRLSDVSLLHQFNLLSIISYALQAILMQNSHPHSSNAIARFQSTNTSSLLSIVSTAIAIANKGISASQQQMMMMMTAQQLELNNSSIIGLQLILSILEQANVLDHYNNINVNVTKICDDNESIYIGTKSMLNEENLHHPHMKRTLLHPFNSSHHHPHVTICLKITDVLLRDDCNYSSKLFSVYEKSLQRQTDYQTTTAGQHDDPQQQHHQQQYQHYDSDNNSSNSAIEYVLRIQSVILQSFAIISSINPRKFFYTTNYTKHIFNTMYHHFISSIAIHQQLVNHSTMETKRKSIGLLPSSSHINNSDRYTTILNALLIILSNAIKFNGKYMNIQVILQDICSTLKTSSSMSYIAYTIPLLFDLMLTTPSLYQTITTTFRDSVMQAIMNSYDQSITALLLLQQPQPQQLHHQRCDQDGYDSVVTSIGYVIKCMIASEEYSIHWLQLHDNDDDGDNDDESHKQRQQMICMHFHVLSNHMQAFTLASMKASISIVDHSTNQDITDVTISQDRRPSLHPRSDELILLVLRLHLLQSNSQQSPRSLPLLLFPDLFASVYRHRDYHMTLCRYVFMQIATVVDPSVIIDLYTQFLVILFSRHIVMNDVGSDVGIGLMTTIEVRAYIVDILERHGACFNDPQALSCLVMKDLVSSQIHDITAIDFKPVQYNDCSSDMVSKRLSMYISLCLDNKGHCLDSLLQGYHNHHHHDHNNHVNHMNDEKLFHCTISDMIALNISLSIIECPTITCCENIIAFKFILPTMNAIKSNHNRLDGDDNNINSDTLNMNSVATEIRRVFQQCVALHTFLLILETIEDDKHAAKEGRRYEAAAAASVVTTTTTTTAHIINHESVSYWSHCSGDGHCSPSSMHIRRLIMNNDHTHNQAVSPQMNRDHTHQHTIAVAATDVDESVESFVCSMFMRYVFVMIEQIIASSTNHHDRPVMMVMKRSGRLVFNTSMLPVRTLLSINEHAANTTLSIEYLALVLDMLDRLAKGLGPSATTSTKADGSKHNSAIGYDMLTVLSVCMSFTEQILSESGHISSSSSNSITSSSQYEHFPLQILKISNEILRRFDHRPGNDCD